MTKVKRQIRTTVFEEDEIDAVDVNRDQVNRCPKCTWVWSKGDLADGSALEIRCSRCGTYFVEAQPILGKNT